jgi:DNA-binding response OmpR family regulator
MPRDDFGRRDDAIGTRRDAAGPPVVLVADQYEDARRMLAILLETQGFATVVCDGGNSTVEAVERSAPDAILLATTTYGDELEIVHHLRRCYGAGCPPIILVTGFHTAEFRSRALAAGCSACLLIPINFSEVVAELERALGQSAPQLAIPPVHALGARPGTVSRSARRTGRSEPDARIRTVRPGGRVARVEKVADHLRNRRRSR